MINQIIKVGICECTNLYKKELNEAGFSTEKEGFLVKLLNIPEEGRFLVLKKGKCKFFIDVHQTLNYDTTIIWTLYANRIINAKLNPYLPDFYARILSTEELIDYMKFYLKKSNNNLILTG